MRSAVVREPELPALRDGWKVSRLDALAETNAETLGAATPLGFTFRYIDLSAVDKGLIDWSQVRETTFRDAPSRARRLVLPDDVLFGTVRPSLQSHGAIPKGEPGPLVASTGFAVIRARPGEADGRFLFHTVMGGLFGLQARRTEVGSNYPAVNESDVKDFLVPHPDAPEQARIAAILDTLDEAIRRTEQVIAKLQQMKQGLLHDLLTRGVDENGDLRPRPDEAPHLYKDSPLGRIPRDWGISSIGTLFKIESGEAPGSLRGEDGPFPLMGANGEIGRCRSANFGPGYVIGRVGAAGAITKVERRVWASDNTLTATPEPTTDFDLGYFLLVAARPSDLATKNAQPLITQTNLSLLPTVYIPEPEQKVLSTSFAQTEYRLGLEQDLVNKFRTIKHGLLHDLLTGRVRVPASAEVPA